MLSRDKYALPQQSVQPRVNQAVRLPALSNVCRVEYQLIRIACYRILYYSIEHPITLVCDHQLAQFVSTGAIVRNATIIRIAHYFHCRIFVTF